METRRLNDRLSVASQIRAEDLPDLQEKGFRAVICNRPDGEAADQPGHAGIAAAAGAEGLAFRYLPVAPGRAGEREAALFARALSELPGPVLAYCRSGARSAALWALVEAGAGPRRRAPIYWQAMLKGREWLARRHAGKAEPKA